MSIVTCEKCHTKFQLSQDEVENIEQTGRVLKCGNCHHMWLVSKPTNPFSHSLTSTTHSPTDKSLIEKLADNHTSTLSLMNTIPDDPIMADFKPVYIPIILKITLYILIFFFILTVLISYKNFFISHVKPVKPILSILGLHDTKGLEFETIKIVKSSFAKDKPLVISGYIINNADQPRLIPDIRMEFIDENDEILQTIMHDIPKKILLPGEKVKIANRIDNYPAEKTDKIIMDIGSYFEFFVR